MHLLSLTSLVALAVIGVTATPSPHVLHEKRDSHPHGWVKRSSMPRNNVLPMRIGLTQSNLEKAEDLLMDVSHPDSPNYGNHYTAEDVVDLFAPAATTIEAVKGWLNASGIKDITLSANKQWLAFNAKVEHAEQLFKTRYHAYEHEETGKINIACDEYHLPLHIREHVDYIMPGLRLLPGKRAVKSKNEKRQTKRPPIRGPIVKNILPKSVLKLRKNALLSKCTKLMSPPCIAALYNITQATKSRPGNEMGIFEEGDFYGKEDLALFFTSFAENIPVTEEPELRGIDGGFDLSVATGESDLDFQVAYPIIYPQHTVLYQTDDIPNALLFRSTSSGIFNSFLDAIDGSYCNFKAYGEKGDSKIDPKYPDTSILGYKGNRMCGVYKPTNVISFSYGLAEASLPANYMRRQCLEYLKLGMQGTTLLFATQDAGVGARYKIDNNNDMCLGDGTVFAPDFPANCPWLLTVGATGFTNGSISKGAEHASDQFGSGGGFSNVYTTPGYQKAAVKNYLTNHEPKLTGYRSYEIRNHVAHPGPNLTKGGRFNRAGRGYPDVSAVGENIITVVDGLPLKVGGTSASTPIFGAIINRINEERLAVGKKTVGFVNPVLYKNSHVLKDITSGSNVGCNTKGFVCAPGWDPATGLGTPNYPALLKLFMSMK